jgi:hypothetical protein
MGRGGGSTDCTDFTDGESEDSRRGEGVRGVEFVDFRPVGMPFTPEAWERVANTGCEATPG